jgi:hypothetical protein
MDRLLDYFTNHPILAGAAVVMAFLVLSLPSGITRRTAPRQNEL